MKNSRITIEKNGPYRVSGGVPLEEKIIRSEGLHNIYASGRPLPQREEYLLCRCGQSKNMPFCDGSHIHAAFDGTETSARESYLEQAESLNGPNLLLTDQENLCAYARFCHTARGDVWNLTLNSNHDKYRDDAIKTACDCPAGRLVAWDVETGKAYEPEYEPSIVILQDPEMPCSGPIWVRGGIPVVSSDGYAYEIRNRVTLCRCGQSGNIPFCDATHVDISFDDSK
jgi:CDGSH-type Zn-finger protein